MYRHPAGTYAIAITNPWVQGSHSPFVDADHVHGSYEITVDLAKYPGLAQGTVEAVYLWQGDGPLDSSVAAVASQEVVALHRLLPDGWDGEADGPK